MKMKTLVWSDKQSPINNGTYITSCEHIYADTPLGKIYIIYHESNQYWQVVTPELITGFTYFSKDLGEVKTFTYNKLNEILLSFFENEYITHSVIELPFVEYDYQMYTATTLFGDYDIGILDDDTYFIEHYEMDYSDNAKTLEEAKKIANKNFHTVINELIDSNGELKPLRWFYYNKQHCQITMFNLYITIYKNADKLFIVESSFELECELPFVTLKDAQDSVYNIINDEIQKVLL